MNQDAKNFVKAQLPTFLQKARVRGYVCPVCDNGTGSTGDGITEDPKSPGRYKCFKCGLSEDVIGLFKTYYRIDDDKEAFKRVYEYYGVNDTDITSYRNTDKQETRSRVHEVDYTDFYKEAQKHLNETEYHRGISLQTLERYGVGYVSAWKHPNTPNAPKTPRLIVPTSKYSYVARRTDGKADYKAQQVGARHVFNLEALKGAVQNTIFVVEGELDALSIIDVGFTAISPGGISGKQTLLTSLTGVNKDNVFIVALDNDEAGQKASTEFMEALERAGFTCYKADVKHLYVGYKDANEAYNKAREQFCKNLSDLKQNPVKYSEDVLSVEREQYLLNATANYIDDFVKGIAEVRTEYTPTGFDKLDEVLEGGLSEGLYVLGAISSAGKTTFALQIADNIAMQGRDVLIFSLEMARNELIAKSISRLTLMDVIEQNISIKNAKTERGITTGARYAYYTQEEKELIQRCLEAYRNYGSHVYIVEGVGDLGAEQIKQTVNNHILFTGNKPVVIVDYLQILAPADPRATDKQNTDKAVIELKRLSRDSKTPVICVSSLNRGSYANGVSMEAFKESGAIEYTADVLLGLQFENQGETGFNLDEAREQNTRNMLLKVLKNRHGKTGGKIKYNYYPAYNSFEERG